MEKLDLDLSIVGAVTILALVVWSNAVSNSLAIGTLLSLLVFLFSYNVFLLWKRKSETRLLRVFHSSMLYLFGVLALGVLLMDEHSVLSGLLYYLVHSVFLLIAYALLCEDSIKQKFFVFGLSCVALLMSVLTIV